MRFFEAIAISDAFLKLFRATYPGLVYASLWQCNHIRLDIFKDWLDRPRRSSAHLPETPAATRSNDHSRRQRFDAQSFTHVSPRRGCEHWRDNK
ncbi:hypothetical protein Nwi_3078 [Nitrobacter winogradskyi Nb-255]|uniref:Uncharacterized protein n=1 Tax=Nitrobacter winogradskyi (strain ATCC 25391 / DSM 10237 / CIP 104748 / NCIMB 11846 / Nb-255) TaxID=323098 RepID=Q3SN15_NITWN|nr:hypothetical protein Nwi_3078 [Nitrobacter winogradskyi Nb-255]